jgi:hypothetical protein
MGVLDFLRAPTKKTPTAAISEMESQLERLRAELKGANEIVESHGQRRAGMLLTDAADADIAKLDADVALARIRAERLELAEVELEERIAAAKDRASREARAAEAERAADAIEAKALALETAVTALAAAYTDFASAVPSALCLKKDDNCGAMPPATPADIGRAVLAQGLYAANPNIFDMMTARTLAARPACVERGLFVTTVEDGVLTRFNRGVVGEECAILPTIEAAEAIVTAPLRRLARELREQTEDAPAATE